MFHNVSIDTFLSSFVQTAWVRSQIWGANWNPKDILRYAILPSCRGLGNHNIDLYLFQASPRQLDCLFLIAVYPPLGELGSKKGLPLKKCSKILPPWFGVHFLALSARWQQIINHKAQSSVEASRLYPSGKVWGEQQRSSATYGKTVDCISEIWNTWRSRPHPNLIYNTQEDVGVSAKSQKWVIYIFLRITRRNQPKAIQDPQISATFTAKYDAKLFCCADTK